MSIISRTRKKQLRSFKSRLLWNQGYDRKIGDWEFLHIHENSSQVKIGDEFDFWCYNKKNNYLLRLRKTKTEKYIIVKSKGRNTTIYLIAELNFKEITDQLIHKILTQFEKNGIPKWKVKKIYTEQKINNVFK
ncbi:hypothetical protein [Aureibacter tunicatorum]|uniref:Uncharacterized protein n=1 Tax=Aureibacter tunicatorum TaxID=866807 RepID=A0AAE4BUT0_9BACT|nr:hypothetical protein [Aureibacter tunicatorum]MDR6241093.1 hypothetical protein [Aureibacter tunicatorum]BDD03871.1 hypothetical protein AUTU_13540 [Aureibacter tunicatorum]